MSIKYAILGYLSWQPFAGYDLKRLLSDSLGFHWSGNNNQVYGSLLELHKEGAVDIEIVQQEKRPARKVYAITQSGREMLRDWILAEPELPAFHSIAHIQLAWSDCLSGEELDGMLAAYERKLEDQAIMYRETMRRGQVEPGRSQREKLLWRAINENQLGFYESELAWAKGLRGRLGRLRPRGGQA
jgi:Predicted transcriptional regulators